MYQHNHIVTVKVTPDTPAREPGGYMRALGELQRQEVPTRANEVGSSDHGQWDPKCPECVTARLARAQEATRVLIEAKYRQWARYSVKEEAHAI